MFTTVSWLSNSKTTNMLHETLQWPGWLSWSRKARPLAMDIEPNAASNHGGAWEDETMMIREHDGTMDLHRPA